MIKRQIYDETIMQWKCQTCKGVVHYRCLLILVDYFGIVLVGNEDSISTYIRDVPYHYGGAFYRLGITTGVLDRWVYVGSESHVGSE